MRRALLMVGVLLVLLGGFLYVGPGTGGVLQSLNPAQTPMPLVVGRETTLQFSPMIRDRYSLLIDVQMTDEQWDAWIEQPSSDPLDGVPPLRVRFSVHEDETIVVEGTRLESPSLCAEGTSTIGIPLSTFRGDPARTYYIRAAVEGPVPDYAGATTTLKVTGSADRWHEEISESLIRYLLGLAAFALGSILLVVYLLMWAFRVRRKQPPRRRRPANLAVPQKQS